MISRLNLFIGTALGVPSMVRDRLAREEGQTFVEYALILVLVAAGAAILIGTTGISSKVTNALDAVKNLNW